MTQKYRLMSVHS